MYHARKVWQMSLAACLLTAAVASAASKLPYAKTTVSTDKGNYTVGEVVRISGSEWYPGEPVVLSIYQGEFQTLRVTYTETADEDGNIANSDFTIAPTDTNVAFRLKAEGRESHLTAETVFSDGFYLNSLSVGSPSPVASGGSATCGVTVQAKTVFGACATRLFNAPVSLSVTSAPPPGVTFALSPSYIPGSGSPNRYDGNCRATSTLTITAAPWTPSGIWTITVKATASAGSGDESMIASAQLVVVDQTPPVANVNPLPVVTGQCDASITTPPTATDAVSGTIFGTTSDPVTYTEQGTYKVNWTYTDPAGNSSSQVQQVVVLDTTPPVLVVGSDLGVATDPGLCTAVVVSLGTTASDNCGNTNLVGVRSDGLPLGEPFSRGTTIVHWTATDGHGNSAAGKQEVAVVDNTPPVIIAPAAVTVGTDPGMCTATGVGLGSPVSSDNCAGTTVTNNAPGAFAKGTNTVIWTVTDASGNVASAPQTVTVSDTEPPVIAPLADLVTLVDAGLCSARVTLPVGLSDNCPGATWAADPASGSNFALGTTTVNVTATDAAGNTSTAQLRVTVENPAPAAGITGPATGAIYAVGTPVNFGGVFTDNSNDVHAARWACDAMFFGGAVDEAAGIVTGTRVFTSAGVYLVSLEVTDQCGGSATANTVDDLSAMIVVYDPNAGYVTGGGWIQSPPGAYAPDAGFVGKANFGFVAKYQKGKSIPTGETEFRFKVGDLNFHSTNYEWLVVSGARAQYKGGGTINGGGEFGFLLTATDGNLKDPYEPDKFRMKITERATGALVYDNQMGVPDGSDPTTVLGGGEIVIHSGGGGGRLTTAAVAPVVATASLPTAFALLPNQPNPFQANTTIHFDLPEAGRVNLVIYSVSGRVVKVLANEPWPAGRHELAWSGEGGDGSRAAAGVYFYRISVQPGNGGAAFTSLRRMTYLR